MKSWILNTSKPRKITTAILVDFLTVAFAVWAALAIRLGEWNPDFSDWPWILLVAPACSVAGMFVFGAYGIVVRYLTLKSVVPILKGVMAGTVALVVVVEISLAEGVPRSLYFIFWLLATGLLLLLRVAVSAYYEFALGQRGSRIPIAIYGAGNSGFHLSTMLARENGEHELKAFFDDAVSLQGRRLNGVPIYARPSIPEVLADYAIAEIWLAIPSANMMERSELIQLLSQYSVKVKTVPNLGDLLSGKADFQDLREIDPRDIMGRTIVNPDHSLFNTEIEGKSILVTGAGGSIGSELCRQIYALHPARIVLFDHSEFALYAIEKELSEKPCSPAASCELISLLGCVRDQKYIEDCMNSHAVDTIFHAAAYKHVPMSEKNVSACIFNNVFGTWAIGQAVVNSSATKMVLISTDKAVRPTNVMGASKRVAELICQHLAEKSHGKVFTMVRFGNVLGSSGSVVPLFKEQIAKGGPVTVTDPDVTRYFMTIPEAAQLVIQAGAMAAGGEVYVLDMGTPIKISDLAQRLISLCAPQNYDSAGKFGPIQIEYTGLRPGEKMHEELLLGEETIETQHPKIMRANETHVPWVELNAGLDKLRSCAELQDPELIRATLATLVEGYPGAGEAHEKLTVEQTAKISC